MGVKRHEPAEMDMTPMIDCVFQLIIFFIVTIRIDESKNETIELEFARHGPAIEREDPRQLIIEVDRNGWISIGGAQLSAQKLQTIMHARYRRYGPYPVLIRGDRSARHKEIRAVMDICTSVGLWRINFAAIKEKKT